MNFSSQSYIFKHLSMLHMAINMNLYIKSIILINFQFQIQFVTFIRGHLGTPIDPAQLAALTFQEAESEVGCEALSCSLDA